MPVLAIAAVGENEVGPLDVLANLSGFDGSPESLRNLRENLAEHNLQLEEIPHVIQINKRDLPDALPVDMVRMVLDPQGKVPMFEAVASKFEGVFEPLRAVSGMVLEKLAQRT